LIFSLIRVLPFSGGSGRSEATAGRHRWRDAAPVYAGGVRRCRLLAAGLDRPGHAACCGAVERSGVARRRPRPSVPMSIRPDTHVGRDPGGTSPLWHCCCLGLIGDSGWAGIVRPHGQNTRDQIRPKVADDLNSQDN